MLTGAVGWFGVQVAITLFLLVMGALMIPPAGTHRPVRPDPLSHLGSCPVRGRCGDQHGVTEPDRADHRELNPGRGGHRAAQPTHIHPDRLLFNQMTSRAKAFGAISAMGGTVDVRAAEARRR